MASGGERTTLSRNCTRPSRRHRSTRHLRQSDLPTGTSLTGSSGNGFTGSATRLAQSANGAAGLSVVAALAQSVATTPLSIGDGLEVVVDRHVLASSIVQTIGEIVDRDRRGLAEFASPPPIADVVVRLLGGLRNGSAIDPFCGLGSFLWALGERAERQSRHLRLAGADINRDAVTVARSVADLLGINIEFVMADTLADPPTGNAYDYVVTAPPWGSRDEPVDTPLLQAPGARRRMELLAIARAYELLAPGGRAVLHLPASVLSSSFSRGLREFLAEQCSVLAIVSLPSRAFQAAATDSVLLVFDRSPAPPGHQTFIAHLGDDWDSQLAADGDTMQAYEQYLRNRGS